MLGHIIQVLNILKSSIFLTVDDSYFFPELSIERKLYPCLHILLLKYRRDVLKKHLYIYNTIYNLPSFY